jgi:phosphoenolpyruvate-protein kinase (PTS system EI component)
MCIQECARGRHNTTISGLASSGKELNRLQQAIEKAQERLGGICEKAVAEVGEETAAMFLAHQEVLVLARALEQAFVGPLTL